MTALVVISVHAQSLNIVSGPIVTHLTDKSAMLLVVVSDKANASDYIENQTIRSFKELDDYLFNLAVENKLDEFHYNKEEVELIDGYGTIKIRLSKSSKDVKQVAQTSSDVKIVVNSGFVYPMNRSSKKASNQIVQQMQGHQPSAVIWMGNTLYYPIESLDDYPKQYSTNINFRLEPSVSRLLQNSNHFAIWNDRDFAPENWDNSPPDKEAAAELFKTFWPTPESETPKKGIYKQSRIGDADFFFLDHLYFKEGATSKLGAHQLFWLKEKLYKSTANFKFIVSGTSFLNSDVSIAQLEEKEEVLAFIRNNKIPGVIFLSSALPHTELSVLQTDDFYPLHEFSCAALTSLGLPIDVQKNSLRVNKTVVKKANFGLITLKEESGQRFCWLESFDQNGGLLWTYPINLKSLEK